MEDVKVQEAVWQVELGPGKRLLLWCGAVFLAVALSLLYTANQFRGLERQEAMDMAQLARNIARGQGFTTFVIRPLSLWQLTEHSQNHQPKMMDHPDIWNPPLYPLALAALFKPLPDSIFEYNMKADSIYRPERWVIVPFSQLCFFASLALVFFWARQLFDLRVAVTTSLLLLFSDLLWSFSISGLPTNFLMLLFLLSSYCLWQADRRWHPEKQADKPRGGGWWLVTLSAVLMGLCFLTRYTMLFLFVPMLVYAIRVCRDRGVVRGAVLYTVLFGAVIAPWMVRNYHVCGAVMGLSHYELAMNIRPSMYHPDFQNSYEMNPIGRHWLSMIRIFFMDSLKQPGMDFLVFFFVVALMFGLRRPVVMRLRRLVWGGLLCVVVGSSFLPANLDQVTGWGKEINGGNLLVLFVPLMAVYGVEFFFLLLARIAFPVRVVRLGAIGLFGVVNAAPLLHTLISPSRPPFPYPPYCSYYTVLASNWFQSDEIGVSDMPWQMAWVGGRRTLWLPNTPEELTEIHDYVAPKGLSFLLFTPFLLDRHLQSDLARGEYKAWMPIIRGAAPKNFPLNIATPFPPNGEQILYCDSPRWTGKETPEPPSTMRNIEMPAETKPATSEKKRP